MSRKIVMFLMFVSISIALSTAFGSEWRPVGSEIILEPGYVEITEYMVYGYVRAESICLDVSDIRHPDYALLVDVYGKPISMQFTAPLTIFLPKGGYYQAPLPKDEYYDMLVINGVETAYPWNGSVNEIDLLRRYIADLNGDISVLKYEKVILEQKLQVVSETPSNSSTSVEELNKENLDLKEENSFLKSEVSRLDALCTKLFNFIIDLFDRLFN